MDEFILSLFAEYKKLDSDEDKILFLESLDEEDREEFIEYAKAAKRYRKNNNINYFNPYPYQKKFMEAGRDYKQRYLRAANRIGKTYGTAIEMSYHLTGRYPDDYTGERVEGSGHSFACIGKTLESISRVLQKELFGVIDARDKEEMGTGAIPRDCIQFNSGLITDGAIIKSAKIKHVDGGYNHLIFYSAMNVEKVIQGTTLKGVWLDEMPDSNADEIYSQLVTRLATTNGFIILTATPEIGRTSIDERFENNTDGILYLQQAGWEDAPHLTPEAIKQLEAGLAPWQIEMRSKGLPILGSGIVFDKAENELIVSDVHIDDNWFMVAGVDFGKTDDPSTVAIMAYNPGTDTTYLVEEIYLDKNRSTKAIADAIKETPYKNVLCVLPHDAWGEAPEAYANQLRDYGINVHINPFNNPGETRLGINVLSKSVSSHKAEIEPGLVAMRYAMELNKFKVHRKCEHWLREKRGYFYKAKDGKQETTGADHLIDASRYAYLSFLGNVYQTVGQSKGFHGNHFNSFGGFTFN